MLNKGPFVEEAIAMLAGILGRMQDHTQKKRSLLRRLRAWDLDATDAGQARGTTRTGTTATRPGSSTAQPNVPPRG